MAEDAVPSAATLDLLRLCRQQDPVGAAHTLTQPAVDVCYQVCEPSQVASELGAVRIWLCTCRSGPALPDDILLIAQI